MNFKPPARLARQSSIDENTFWRPQSVPLGNIVAPQQIVTRLVAWMIGLPLFLIAAVLSPIVRVRVGLLHHRSTARLPSNSEYYMRRTTMHPPSRREFVVFLSGTPVNRQILTMISRRLRVIESDRLWKLLATLQAQSLSRPLWVDMRFTGFDKRKEWFVPGPQLSFTDEEDARGKTVLRSLGIPDGAPYVCIHAKDRLYVDSPDYDRSADDFWFNHDFRDCDIQNFMPAAAYLADQGIYVVRVGVSAEQGINADNPQIIDYSFDIRPGLNDPEFADIYLQAHCKFFVGNVAGIYLWSSIFGVPVAYANMVPICDNGRAPDDIFIPKKYFHRPSNAFIPYRQIFDRGWEMDFLTRQQLDELKTDGIEIVENTADEILALVKEMNMRLDGTWPPQDEGEALQQSYRAIFPPHHHMRDFPGRVGAAFLRQNKTLLHSDATESPKAT